MRGMTLDNIVRSILLNRGLTKHWYFKFLKLTADCVQELSFDTLKIVEGAVLDVDNNGRAELPENYVDWVKVGYGESQIFYPLIEYDAIKFLPNKDEDGNIIPYPGIFMGRGAYYADFWEENTSLYYEDLGRQYGNPTSSYGNGFKIVGKYIQLSQAFKCKKIVLEYIGDGSGCNGITKVTPYAKSTIEAYVAWKNSRNRDNKRSPEGQAYYSEEKVLRGRMNGITYEGLVAIIENSKAIAK